MKFPTVLLLASTVMFAGQVLAKDEAATLQDLTGKVLMNKGDGLVSGKAGAALVDGDRIVTLDKSGARVVFRDGCDVNLKENMVFVVDAEKGCKAVPLASGPGAAGVGLTSNQVVLGTAIVGGGAIIIGNGRGNQPISPQ